MHYNLPKKKAGLEGRLELSENSSDLVAGPFPYLKSIQLYFKEKIKVNMLKKSKTNLTTSSESFNLFPSFSCKTVKGILHLCRPEEKMICQSCNIVW